MINLGQKAKDILTPFKGTAFGRLEYLNGCVRILIQPDGLQDNGQPIEACWFDESQCVPQQSPVEAKPKEGPMRTDPKIQRSL